MLLIKRKALLPFNSLKYLEGLSTSSCWFVGWNFVPELKKKPVLNEDRLSVTRRRKPILTKCLRIHYTRQVLKNIDEYSQFLAAAFISLLNKNDWLEKCTEEFSKFCELIENNFYQPYNEIYSYDTMLGHPIVLCSENKNPHELLVGILLGEKKSDSKTAEDSKRMKELLKNKDTFLINKIKLEEEIVEELKYVAHKNSVPDNLIVKALLNAKEIVEFGEIKDFKFFDYYYRALIKLDKNSTDFIENRQYFFQLIHSAVKDGYTKLLIPFLPTYAHCVKLGEEEYSLSLLQSLKDRVGNNSNITIEDKFSILKARIMMRHCGFNETVCIKDCVISNPELVEESIENLYVFLESIGLKQLHDPKNKSWYFLKSFISELKILQNEEKWNESELFYHLNVAKALALFGIYPRPLLNSLHEKCNKGTITDDRELLNLMVILNQSIYALHPSFNKSFLSEITLSSVLINLERNCEELEKLNEFTDSVKENLESEAYESDCILKNCYTKQGLKINLVVALNEANEPFSFTAFLKSPLRKIYVEEISLPKNFQLILIILVDENNHERFNRGKPVDTATQLKLKSLQACGYMTVYKTRAAWESTSKRELRPFYFWKKIHDRNSCSIPEGLLEKAREPTEFY